MRRYRSFQHKRGILGTCLSPVKGIPPSFTTQRIQCQPLHIKEETCAPCFSHPALVIVGNCCPACNCPSPAAHRISTNLRYQTRQPSNWCAALPSTRPEHWPSTTRPSHHWLRSGCSIGQGHSRQTAHIRTRRAAITGRQWQQGNLSHRTGIAQQRNRNHPDRLRAFYRALRTLDEARIERYLKAEQPFDCAGGFKAEGLGISLFRSTEGEDVTSLVGLPLIRTVDMLLNEGIDIP